MGIAIMRGKPELIVVGSTDAPVCEDGVCAVPETESTSG